MSIQRSAVCQLEPLESRTLFATLIGGVDPANLGKGDWIFNVATAETNMGVTNIQALANKLQQGGIKWVVVKAGDGNDGPTTVWTQFSADLINTFHGVGLKVFGYHLVYGGAVVPLPKTNISTIDGEIAVSNQIAAMGDGLVVDPEVQYESAPSGPANAATQYMTAIRTANPTKFIAYAPLQDDPLPYISLHPNFPFLQFQKVADAVMPQAFWRFIGKRPAGIQTIHGFGETITPQTMVDDIDSEFSFWYRIWLSAGNPDALKPIVPVGQGFDDPGDPVLQTKDITDFVTALKTDVNPASPGGYNGVSFWNVDTHTTLIWNGIFASTIGLNGIVKGSVFNDVNGNGKRDVDEVGIASIIVYDDANNNKSLDPNEAQTVTDASGNFTLINLSGATHKIRQVVPNTFRQSAPTGGFGIKETFTTDGQTIVGANFGQTQMALITGTVFNDKNGNGFFNSKEVGIPTWRVYIDANDDGRFEDGEQTMRADSKGVYSLVVNPNATYRVRAVAVGGFRQTTPVFYDVTLGNGGSALRNFGETTRVLITGTVFDDLNANGIREKGEDGIANRRVFVDLDGDGIWDVNEYSAITDANGFFRLRTTPAGKYKLRILSIPGFISTAPVGGYHNLNLTSGQSISNRLFGQHERTSKG